jgi:hypothetical protein
MDLVFTESTPVKYSSPFYFIYLFLLYYKFISWQQLNLSHGVFFRWFPFLVFLLSLYTAATLIYILPARLILPQLWVDNVFSFFSSNSGRYRLTSGSKLIVNLHVLVLVFLYSALQTAQCYMSADSSCISNCADGHTFTECCYKTVNCEQLIYCNIPAFMQFGLLCCTEWHCRHFLYIYKWCQMWN